MRRAEASPSSVRSADSFSLQGRSLARGIGFVLVLVGGVGFLATLALAAAFAVLWGRVGIALLFCGGTIALGAALRERDEEANGEWRIADSREDER